MFITKDQIIEAISSMSVMDIVDLIAAMEEKFGISAVMSVNNNVINEVAEEKTEFDILLKSVGANKVAVIKAVRSITSLGLKESKDLVESAPTTLKGNINKDEAESLKKILEEVGAEIEIR